MGLPIGAETSIPSWGRAMWRIGCVRIEENALDSQPRVGMIEGVAANLAVCSDRLSAASLNDMASRLARRISALMSKRISAERRVMPVMSLTPRAVTPD